MRHIMGDTETWGTLPGSALRSIGAVAFDPETGAIGEGFLVNVDRASCKAAGLVEDPKTVKWWSEQNAAAQAALEGDALPLRDALAEFGAWWMNRGGRFLWCHGACFDEPILRVAFGAVGMSAPWDFWNVRDTRTIYDLAGVKPDKGQGVEHHALDDAVRQARAVIDGYARLSRGLGPAWSTVEDRLRRLEAHSHPPIELSALAEAAATAAVRRIEAVRAYDPRLPARAR